MLWLIFSFLHSALDCCYLPNLLWESRTCVDVRIQDVTTTHFSHCGFDWLTAIIWVFVDISLTLENLQYVLMKIRTSAAWSFRTACKERIRWSWIHTLTWIYRAKVHFSISHVFLIGTLSSLGQGPIWSECACVSQCGRWRPWQWRECICGSLRHLWLQAGDPRWQTWPGLPGQPALRTHLSAEPRATPPPQAPALPVHPPQACRGRSHQALPLNVRELWALVGPPGQTGGREGTTCS